MQMGPGMRQQPQVQRPMTSPVLPQVPTRPQPTMGQQGAPIYNPSGPQPQIMSGGTPVTAPVIAPRPTAGPMPAPAAPQAPAMATTGMPAGQPLMRR
jgi:hypothetical protein